ncbi:MAG: D-alanyl-D-alanine carboxypeptidase [Chloroflexi bacterium]|nr:D-alanyl-D-alanine carboxypeptidase [Chloroflexota bacterium]
MPVKLLLICLMLVVSLAMAGFGPPVLTDGNDPPLRLYPEQVRAMRRLAQPPAVSAASALMIDLDAGQTLYARRSHDPLPPASTGKLMTALLTLQKANLADRVTISANAAETTGSRMGLASGETLTVRDLLYGLLLPSGNDAAVTLAEHVAGSETAFVALMNETAASMGLAQTHFANAHGLDDPEERTSAADLARITQAALAYPAFVEIVAQDTAFVAERSLQNTNLLLGLYRGADGVKTGTTVAAGECLVASVTRGGHRLLVVVLGSSDRYADATALLDFAAANWQWRPMAVPDDALAWEMGQDGQAYRLRTAQSPALFLPIWQWRLAQPVLAFDPSVPLTATVPVGTLTLNLGHQVIASAQLTVWDGP